MVRNIAVVGLYRELSYEVAKILSQELDMFFFDALELFEFDNAPRNLSMMLQEYGEDFYRKKEKSIIGYSSEFTNCVINLEGGMSESESNFQKIKETSLLIYLSMDVDFVKEKLKNQEYSSNEEKHLFDVDKQVLASRDFNLKEKSNIIIDASSGSALKIASETIRAIKNYYKIS